MNDFATLFFKIDETNKTNDKVEALENFLIKASPTDRIWMIALFTGRQPKRTVTSRYLKEWLLEKTQCPEWLFEETYHVIGDLAETLALLLPQHPSVYQSTLTEWMEAIQAMPKQTLAEKKKTILHFWDQLDPKERLVFNKALTGGFRLGVSQNLIIKAVANVSNIDPNIIAHRLMGNWDPSTINPDFLLAAATEESYLTQPYPFCLAYPLDTPLEDFGSPSEWLLEWKWDGIRSQAVYRQEDHFTLWSRGEEIVNERFPELMHLQDLIPEGTVLDGEILACQGDDILPFQILQQRIGRKKVTAAILKEIPVIFLAYDILEWEGKDLRAEPLQKRRELLENLIKNISSQYLLRLSPKIEISSWEKLKELRQESREKQAEGIMLKKMDSIYHVGRKRGDWWKWKIESYTVDGVLLYAQKGHGWRANVYSDYTLAVWDEDKLIPFTKAYSGLTKKELDEVDRFIKKNTLEKFGPVRSVKPELVFEIAFEGIQLSKRHKSGIAVRFPRIQRWRRDKKPEEADSIDTLRALIYTPE